MQHLTDQEITERLETYEGMLDWMEAGSEKQQKIQQNRDELLKEQKRRKAPLVQGSEDLEESEGSEVDAQGDANNASGALPVAALGGAVPPPPILVGEQKSEDLEEVEGSEDSEEFDDEGDDSVEELDDEGDDYVEELDATSLLQLIQYRDMLLLEQDRQRILAALAQGDANNASNEQKSESQAVPPPAAGAASARVGATTPAAAHKPVSEPNDNQPQPAREKWYRSFLGGFTKKPAASQPATSLANQPNQPKTR